MIATYRECLLQKLVELGQASPDMRFGQLLVMACSLAEENEPCHMQNSKDEVVLQRLEEHMTRRFGPESPHGEETIPELRRHLIQELEKLSERWLDWSLGRLVFNLASLAHRNEYDIEDEELLAVAKSDNPGLRWFDWYVDKLVQNSVVIQAQPRPSYRCPCCHHLTLCGRGGFEICPVCYWEDDGQDDADADRVRGGPNGVLSLAKARENYRTLRVCDGRFVENVRPPRATEV